LSGNGAEAFLCDVSDPGQVRNLASFAQDSFGAVSVLMNNAGAGLNPGKPWENPDGWKKLIDINLWGSFMAYRRSCLPCWRAWSAEISGCRASAGLVSPSGFCSVIRALYLISL